MKILLVAATEMEIMPALNAQLQHDTLIGGVGVPSTIYRLIEKLAGKRYGLVIQAGIGGSFDEALMPGTVGFITQDCFADLAIEEKGSLNTVFDLGFADGNAFPFSDGWLKNGYALPKNTSLPGLKAITVNKISDDPGQTTLLKNKYGAAIESMEGAAVHYVCLQQQVPFVQLRSVSNAVGERDKSKWRMREAIDNLNNTLQQLIKTIQP